jgi:ribosome maturation factor RimP
MPATSDNIRRVVEPVVAEHGLDLFDLERSGGRLVVTVDRAPDGVDLDTIATVTRALSRALDDADVISSRYLLEVTSPGLERTLRNPAQYQWAIGKTVSVRLTAPETTEAPDRRTTGTLVATDEAGIELLVDGGEVVHLPYASIQKARTVVDWEAELKAGSSPAPGGARPEHQRVSNP